MDRCEDDDYYVSCSACGRISGNLSSADSPLCCANHSLTAWPSSDAREFIRQSKQQHLREGRRLSTVYLAAALEAIVGDMVQMRDARVGVFEKQLELERRLGTRLSSLLAAAGYPDFMRSWNHLIQLRNDITHGKWHELDSMDAFVMARLKTDILPVMAYLANELRTKEGGLSGGGRRTSRCS